MFKKYWRLVASVLLLMVFSGVGLKLQALGSNIVANPSVETVNPANSALPTGWVKDKWGTNTSTLSYGSDAHTGTKGLSVSITKYTSGDAKWYFSPVTVKPSTSYTFSDYSKSNIASSVVAMYTSTTGAITYTDLASTMAAHSAWTQKSITFTTPANVKTMTVFHLINKVGTLQTDDFNLAETNAAVTAPTVSLTTPANGATVSSDVNFSANASNATSVQYKVDGVNVGSALTTSPYSYTWSSTTVANGTHTISAVATNSGGSATASAAVTVSNTTPAPTVSLTTPANNATVSGQTSLSATATNALGVQFKVDGVNVGAEVTTGPYTSTWDSTSVANGTHTVSVTARNAGGTTTATATVTVNNVAPSPTIAITAPTANSTVAGQVNVTTGTTNTVGVQFKIDGVNAGAEDTAAPYTYSWDTTTTTNASHVITAVARNSSSQLVTSAPVTVTVYNAPAPIVTNLVANPSVETADAANPQLPASWANNKWGTNTAIFTYPVAGHTGSDATRVEITSYSSGDAKWYFSPIPVTASTTYQFSDWYRSNTQTSIVVELQNASGGLSYLDLGTVAASTTWTQTNLTFTTKADTTAITVYHLINSTGYLETDDTSVTKPAPAGDGNPIANNSLELANGTAPASWTHSSWGTNTASFQYINEGHTGTKSVKTTVSNYTNGDAKWYYNPVKLENGKQFRWTTWYKTNTRPQAVAMFVRADGSEEFFGMPQPFPSSDSSTVWHQYTETFIVPADAVSVTNFLFITGNGWVQVDDQSLTSYQPVGWNRPLVTLTFDDGYEGNVANAIPVLDQYGFKTTQCFETMDLQADPVNGKANVMAFVNDGHEICSHTVTHPYLSQLTTAQVDKELADSKTYLENLIGKPVVDFASPFGDYSESVNTEIMKYYQSHRTVDEGFNSKDNFDPYRIRVQNMTPTTTLAQYQGWLDQAKADNTWLVLVYHRITNETPEAFDTPTADFKKQMAALSASGLTVKTYYDALAELKAQQ
jgi:hypothetical protein